MTDLTPPIVPRDDDEMYLSITGPGRPDVRRWGLLYESDQGSTWIRRDRVRWTDQPAKTVLSVLCLCVALLTLGVTLIHYA